MSELFLRIFKHLLPNSAAWNITKDKNLRRLHEGLTGLGSDVKNLLTYHMKTCNHKKQES